MKRALIFIFVFLLLFGFAGAFGYFQFMVKPEMIKGIIANMPRPVPSVAATTAKTARWTPGISAIGTTRAFQGIDVSSQLGGMVAAIHFGSGQDVAKGAPLFDLDTTVEEADLKNNMATLKNAEATLLRQRELSNSNNTTRANVDAAEAARDSAAALVERAKRTIALKTVVASFSGRLGIRKVDVGQYVSPGTSLITLQQLDPIYTDFPVPEQALGQLKPGQTVKINVDAYPGVTFSGQIALVDARIATESRSVLVRAQFPNADRRLLPGMFANVRVEAGTPRDVVTVPRTAVSFSLYGDSVFVATPAPPPAGSAQAAPAKDDKPYKIERRFVRTGEIQENDVAIEQGLKEGEVVVSEGQIKLQNNATVTIDPKAGLVPPAVRHKE